MPNACPTLNLLGRGSTPERNEVLVGSIWVDPGATARDPEDGDLTDLIVRDASDLDTATPGVYLIRYSVEDADGCVSRATRYVRVIALVATSDPTYLRQLCLRQVPMAAMTCEVGMHTHEKHLPNPAAFPACCLVASEMDAAACFCDGAVVAELNARNDTFFQDLQAFTPMACGFKLKTGDVCTDARALETFLTEESITVDDTIEVATVEELISEGGALDASLPCADQVEAAAAMCQRLTRTTPGPAPLVTDFVPCCAAVSVLNASECLCDVATLDGDRSTFLRQLVGFAPLGCGFALTGSCPTVLEERFELPNAFTVEGVPEIRPVAGVVSDDAAWRFLVETERETVDSTDDDRMIRTVVDGGAQLYNFATCEEYAALAPEACGAVRVDARVSTFELTACCAFLHAAHARGCLCPGAGVRRFAAINPDLEVIAPAACALRLDAPPPLGEATCKTTLTLEEVLSPAAAAAFAEGVDFVADDAAAVAFFEDRNVTLASLAEVAREATPVVVTTPTVITLAATDEDSNVTTTTEHEVPLGSVVGVVSRDAIDPDATIRRLVPEPFAMLELGATYKLPTDAIVSSNVTSRAATEARGEGDDGTIARATAVAVGADERLVVTVPDPEGAVRLPWMSNLEPAPAVKDAARVADPERVLPVAVVTDSRDGAVTLVPLPDGGVADEATRRAIADAEGREDVYASSGLIYGVSDDARLGATVPSATSSCLVSVILAEASCIPVLESVADIFELDVGWRACCARVAAANADGCFCDGAVAAALDVASRAGVHARVMDALPGACGFAVTTGDACPVARFEPATIDDDDAVDVTTSGASASPGVAFVVVDAGAYEPGLVSAVTASGAVVVSATRDAIEPVEEIAEEFADAPVVVSRVAPTLIARAVLTPQTPKAGGELSGGVVMDGDGVVRYESAALPGVIVEVDASGAAEEGTTVLSGNGTVTRLRADEDADDDADVEGGRSSAVSVLPRGYLEASVGDESTEVALDAASEGAAAAGRILGLDAVYDSDAGRVALTLPDGTVVSADAAAFIESGGASQTAEGNGDDDALAPGSSAPFAPVDVLALDPEDHARPLPGYGVVVRGGEVVPALGVDEEMGDGPCDPVRKYKNFLTASLEPGAETFVVMGAVSHCVGSELSVPELTVPIKYRPRGAEGYAPPLTDPVVECLGLTLVDLEGRVIVDNLCDRFDAVVRDYGVDVRVRDARICVDCALTGRGSDGALFRISHPKSDTLTAMQPTVMSLECDLDAVDDIEGGRRRLLRVGGGRRLAQFLTKTYSYPTEVNDFFSRLAPVGGGEEEEEERDVRENGENKYGLVGDGVGDERGGNDPSSDSNSAASDSGSSDVPRCDGDVTRLANNVQWWSRGAGPLEPGLPNDPYGEYVFAGSINVLSGGDSSPADLDGVVLPIVFSPWVLDAAAGGDWRAVRDPAAELDVRCAGATTRLPDGTLQDRPDPCGDVSFALSAYTPPADDATDDETGGETPTTETSPADAPAVLLLEVIFRGELCDGCRLAGAGAQGELFRVSHAGGANLDFVGPTVGALECAPAGAVGVEVEASPPIAPEVVPGGDVDRGASSFVVEGEDRDTSSCSGRAGLNLKGELLNDGGSHIKAKAEDCCADCREDPRCNVWVYCEGDCVDYAYHSCWLKRAPTRFGTDAPAAWAASDDVPWTSGWFPPKEGLVAIGGDFDAETSDETSDETSARAGNATDADAPRVRVVPVGDVAPPLDRASEDGEDGDVAPSDGDVAPSDTPVSVDVPVASEPVTFTLVPGEPVVIPASQITIIPSETAPGENENVTFTVVEEPLAPVTTDESTRSAPISIPDPAATTCDASGAFACGGDSNSSADPLGSTRVRGSFQLLRARDAETGGRVAESLTLLRPGDETTEIFVTGTLINANADAVCLTDLEVPFDFPRTVARRPGEDPVVAPAEDFVVQCYYVGVRSREASAAPGTDAAAAARFPPDAALSREPRRCEDTVSLAMTDAGPVMAFRDDVALCPGCWLVGGRDGVLFSWKHREGLPMTIRAGDAAGDGAPRCALVE